MEQKRQEQREQEFKAAWRKEVDFLKWWEEVCRQTLEEKRFPPFSESQVSLVAELQQVSYKLDVLCGLVGTKSDQKEILKKAGYKL